MSEAKAYEDPGTPEEQSRRTFMANATIAIGGVIGLVIGVPVVAYTIPSQAVMNSGGKSWSPVDQAEFDKLKNSELPLKISFTHNVQDGYLPAAEASDYVWGVKMSDAQFQQMQQQRADLFQNPAGKVPYPVMTAGYVIFSSICPHLGCRFNWDTAKTRFFCPCHNSEYERNGEHVAGPAARGLDPLPLQDQSGKAQITWIRYKSTIPDRVVVSYT